MQKDQSCKKLRLLVALMMPLDEIYLGNKLFLNNCNFSPDEEGHDYDSALELAGYGGFHYWLAFICGWANASDAVEILCISFLLPSAGLTNKKFPWIITMKKLPSKSYHNKCLFYLNSAECDLELTPARKGWLSAILFVGMMIGSPFSSKFALSLWLYLPTFVIFILGGYIWGSLADSSMGRRVVLINAM